MVAEADQEDPVARGERLLEKAIEIFVVSLDEFGLAAAEIDNQAEIERDIGAVSEKGDLLRRAVLEYLEVLLWQIGY